MRRHFVWKGLAFLVLGTAAVAAVSFVGHEPVEHAGTAFCLRPGRDILAEPGGVVRVEPAFVWWVQAAQWHMGGGISEAGVTVGAG